MIRKAHLVAYHYGQGSVWAIVNADSREQIEQDFPELTIVEDAPAWITPAELAKIREVHSYDIDQRAFGLLAEIIDARGPSD